MEGLKKIMAAIDFSDYSLPTLRYALALAEDVGAEVVVVSVINERDVAAIRAAMQYTDQVNEESYIQAQKEDREVKTDQLIEQAGCGQVKVEKIFKVGVPASELLRAIEETGADLVVVGTKGRTNLATAIFGSVAEKIHRRSPASVLSVRGKEHADLVCKLNA